MKLYPTAKGSTRNRHVIKPARAIINFASDLGLCPPMRVRGFHEAMVVRQASDRAWVDQFRAHASSRRQRVLCLFMFVTGARSGEAVKLEPKHLRLDEKLAIGPPTKNGDAGVYHLTDELVEELRALEPQRCNRGQGPLRVFGMAVMNKRGWRTTCRRAGITYLTPHEAGRHGFGTETIVRRGLDVATAADLGRWRDRKVLLQRYAHAKGLALAAEDIFGNGVQCHSAGTRPGRMVVSR